MAYDAITSAEIQVGKPEKQSLWQKVKDDFDYLYGAVASASGALPANGSFETDSDGDGIPDSWTRTLYPGGSGAFETTSPAHAAKAYKFVHPGGSGNGGGKLVSEYIEVTELTGYNLSFIHWASVAGMRNKVQAAYYAKDKSSLSTTDIYNSTSNPTSATFYQYAFTPPANARYVKIVLIGGYTDTDVAGNIFFDGVLVSPESLPDSSVTQAKLKTTTGSVSGNGTKTLPGGEYGFYPQIKTSVAHASKRSAFILDQMAASVAGWTTYATKITIHENTYTIYAQQRYVQSSGEVHWIFILRNKATKKVTQMWQSPDHPCMGNGGKPKLLPNPFFPMEPVDPAHPEDELEVICINPTKEEVAAIHKEMAVEDESVPDRDFLEVIEQDYDLDESVEPPWPSIPVTVALPRDWEDSWLSRTPVAPIKKVIPKPADVRTAALKKKIKI